MAIVDQLNDDLKAAMRSGDKTAVATIRGLKSMLRDKEIEKNDALTEDEEIKVLSTAAKQRREAIESYELGGRDDLVQQEQAELKVIEQYLPEQMDTVEIESLADEVIAEVGAESMRDMGRVMGAIMPRIQGKADGSEVQSIVKQKLS